MPTKRVYFNDTVTPLAGDAAFTGTTRDTDAYDGNVNPFGGSMFTAMCVSSHVSATAGFKIEMSNDGSTWRTAASSTLVADTPNILTVFIVTRYYRVKLTNAGTLQTNVMLNSAIVS